MAWERRARGTRYYTRSRKVAGRVVREYVGGGLPGALAAKLDAAVRAKRQQDARAWNELRTRLEHVESAGRQLCEATDVVVRAVLILAGYHQHHRGEWRKDRARGHYTRGGRGDAHSEEVQPTTETSCGPQSATSRCTRGAR
jgi:hypothetical protein